MIWGYHYFWKHPFRKRGIDPSSTPSYVCPDNSVVHIDTQLKGSRIVTMAFLNRWDLLAKMSPIMEGLKCIRAATDPLVWTKIPGLRLEPCMETKSSSVHHEAQPQESKHFFECITFKVHCGLRYIGWFYPPRAARQICLDQGLKANELDTNTSPRWHGQCCVNISSFGHRSGFETLFFSRFLVIVAGGVCLIYVDIWVSKRINCNCWGWVCSLWLWYNIGGCQRPVTVGHLLGRELY